VVRIWDARTGGLLERLRGHESSAYSVAFTPDGCGLVSGYSDDTLKYWDVSHLANGLGGRQNFLGASKRDNLNGKKDHGTREGNTSCTIKFPGHKVRVKLADRGVHLSVEHRGVYRPSLSHTMVNGW